MHSNATGNAMTHSPPGRAGRYDLGAGKRIMGAMLPRSVYMFSAWTTAVAIVLTIGLIGYAVATKSGLDRLQVVAAHRLDVVAASLDGELARFEYLPSLLE